MSPSEETLAKSQKKKSIPKIACNMRELMEELYPICRSITGDGLRKTLKVIQQHIPISIKQIASGTDVFDWTIPDEWNIKEAYIKNPQGEKIVDFKVNNLHVVNYSTPVDNKLSLDRLKEHLYTLPEHPNWIPYRTSYYKKDWGFCMAYNQFAALEDGEYEVYIDSTLEKGNLDYGELLIKGESQEEVLISTHVCHPSLCNDNLSGICIATFLANWLMNRSLRYSYRFLFIPGTIGAIGWLAFNEANTSRIKHGLVLSLLGDSGNFTYKKSRRGDAKIDEIATYVLKNDSEDNEIIDFFPYGYDERQYCSPGFNLPVGSLTRTPFAQFPEYHTSADNLGFVSSDNLEESLRIVKSVMTVIENNRKYINLNPKCEPQLGKRGLYSLMGGNSDSPIYLQMALLWLLNFSDGNHSLLDISERSGYDFDLLHEAAQLLKQCNLIEEVSNDLYPFRSGVNQ